MRETPALVSLAVAVCLAASGCDRDAPTLIDEMTADRMGDRPAVETRVSTLPRAQATDGVSPVSGQSLAAPASAATARGSAAQSVRGRGRPTPITFDDLELAMPEDSVFESGMLTPRVKELDGQRVRIRGFIFPSIFQQHGITQFPLVKNTQCKFGPGGVAHHVILVDLRPGVSTSFTVRPIAVEGVLTVRPWTGPDGMTWTVYHLLGDSVE